MSLQYTLEIENFSREQNLIIDVDSFKFSQFPHLTGASAGKIQVKEIVISRSPDKYSSLFMFAHYTEKSFPKAGLQVKSSDGGQSYLFTFRKVSVGSYLPYDDALEQIKLVFDEYSYEEISPVGNAAKPGKSKKLKRK